MTLFDLYIINISVPKFVLPMKKERSFLYLKKNLLYVGEDKQ